MHLALKNLVRLLASVLLEITALVTESVRAATPEVGDQAPDFLLRGNDGRMHGISEYKGKQAVVLAWFPKAFTPG